MPKLQYPFANCDGGKLPKPPKLYPLPPLKKPEKAVPGTFVICDQSTAPLSLVATTSPENTPLVALTVPVNEPALAYTVPLNVAPSRVIFKLLVEVPRVTSPLLLINCVRPPTVLGLCNPVLLIIQPPRLPVFAFIVPVKVPDVAVTSPLIFRFPVVSICNGYSVVPPITLDISMPLVEFIKIVAPLSAVILKSAFLSCTPSLFTVKV